MEILQHVCDDHYKSEFSSQVLVSSSRVCDLSLQSHLAHEKAGLCSDGSAVECSGLRRRFGQFLQKNSM